MHLRVWDWVVGALVATASVGCASQKSSTAHKGDSARQLRAPDGPSERATFAQDARLRLDQLNEAIVILAVRVHDHGDEAQQEEWGEWLLQLKQLRNDLDQELIEAPDTPNQDWPARHAKLEEQVQKLELVVNQTALAILEDLSAGPRAARATPSGAPAGIDLCQVQVQGTNAAVRQEGYLLIVQLTAPDPKAAEQLRERAERLLEHTSDEPVGTPGPGAPSQGDAASERLLELQVTVIDDGVVFTFAPANGELPAMKAQLEETAQRIDQQRC